MFEYSDPTGTGVLVREGALQAFRGLLHTWYRQEARKANSAFTLLSAFDAIRNDSDTIVSTVEWAAFPKISSGSDAEIDANRFLHQDEYVEWRVERGSSGDIERIVFTTELYEPYQALAEVGEDALISGIRDIIPGANPTRSELFGPGFNPASASSESRGEQFVSHRRMNPWNNGEKGILFLGHRNNTGLALFVLVGDCAIDRGINPAQVCSISSCVPGRNSDPSICAAVQHLAQSNRVLSILDPAGIRIMRLDGIWKRQGQVIDINDLRSNGGVWTVTRNGRRAVLDVSQGITIGDDRITTGAQVSRALLVGADAISAPSAKVPAWAQTGHESSRMIG